MTNAYRIGHTYIDKGKTAHSDDQFLAWLNIKNSGMLNSPGIRPFSYVTRRGDGIPAYIVLVTTEKKGASHNPWDDIVDYSSGKVFYWGDAKFDDEKKHNEFRGNQILELVYNLILERKYALVPPILHFSKPERGLVKFNGLCVMDKLELTWFEDRGVPVRNYRCHLSILDEEEVRVNWLHERATSTAWGMSEKYAPSVWRNYQRGKIQRLNLWKKHIRSKDQQLPKSNTPESKILQELIDLTPTQFEQITVALFKQLPDITHAITQTRPTADGGFDFFGHFVLPQPVSYEIDFLGEAKKFARDNPVQPKDVSRLVARLGRGQYGIFVTTSYFTRQTQQEVLDDGYPVKLFSGDDLVLFMKELRLVDNGHIRKEWLDSLL